MSENENRRGTSDEPPEERGARQETESTNGTRKYILWGFLAVLLIAGVIYGIDWYRFAAAHESTDNAQIEGNISPVIPRVEGYVDSIYVDDNERVEKGALLLTIDTADYKVNVNRREAAVKSARAAHEDALAQLEAARAQEEQSEVALRQARTEKNRQEELYNDHSATRQAYDNAEYAYESAQAQYKIAQRKVKVAQVKVQSAKANIEQAQSSLEEAQLQLSYTKLKAPIAGRVSKKNVETGQYIRPGSPLMAIANDRNVWVVANFKEGQISQIREGQPVDIEVDAYPDTTFDGKVQSIGGATGSKFALLPPDNASGNFVKVEQRIPVKITLTEPVTSDKPLKPGMNVVPTVKVN